MTKADKARALLAKGMSVADVARKVPMAYSQAHSIAAKMGKKAQPHEHPLPGPRDRHGNCPGCAGYDRSQIKPADRKRKDEILEQVKEAKRESRRGKPKQLTTGPLPKDTPVGACANCGFDLVVRPMPGFFLLIHTNASAEDYLRTIQFCHAVPARLLPAKGR